MKVFKIRVINPEIWDDFNTYILEKYGNKYLVKTLEIEEAVYHHLARKGYKNYNVEINGSEIFPCTHKKLKPRQISFLKTFEKDFISDKYIPNNLLESYITKELGVSDNRSVGKWKSFLENMQFIERTRRGWKNIIPLDWEGENGVVVYEDG